MIDKELDKLKYLIGKFKCPNHFKRDQIDNWISVLEDFPNQFENLVSNLSEKHLNTSYRPEGWIIRQVIHHMGDSHHHSAHIENLLKRNAWI